MLRDLVLAQKNKKPSVLGQCLHLYTAQMTVPLLVTRAEKQSSNNWYRRVVAQSSILLLSVAQIRRCDTRKETLTAIVVLFNEFTILEQSRSVHSLKKIPLTTTYEQYTYVSLRSERVINSSSAMLMHAINIDPDWLSSTSLMTH